MFTRRVTSISDRTTLLDKTSTSDGRMDYGQIVSHEASDIEESKVKGCSNQENNSQNQFAFIQQKPPSIKDKMRKIVRKCQIL